MEEPRDTGRMAVRFTALLGALVALAGVVLLLGAGSGEEGLAGIGVALQTLLGGALLVAAALIGLTSALLWLLAARRERRLR